MNERNLTLETILHLPATCEYCRIARKNQIKGSVETPAQIIVNIPGTIQFRLFLPLVEKIVVRKNQTTIP